MYELGQSDVTNLRCYRDLLFHTTFYCLDMLFLMEAPAGKNTLMSFLERNIPQCRVNVLYKVFDAIFQISHYNFWVRRKYPLIVQNVSFRTSNYPLQ